jgi:hypothetical protein
MMHRYFVVIAVLVAIVNASRAQGSESQPIRAICIEHAGDSDKPVAGIAITGSDRWIKLCRKDSDDRVGLTNVWEHIVDLKLVSRLIAIVEGTSSDEDEHPHEFGTLLVVVIKGDNKHVVVLNRAHSVLLLRELQKSCTDRSLRSRLENLQNRIGGVPAASCLGLLGESSWLWVVERGGRSWVGIGGWLPQSSQN